MSFRDGQRVESFIRMTGVAVDNLGDHVSGHHVFADLSPEQAHQRSTDTARIGAGNVGMGDDRLGSLGQPLVGLNGLAPPFHLTVIPVEEST